MKGMGFPGCRKTSLCIRARLSEAASTLRFLKGMGFSLHTILKGTGFSLHRVVKGTGFSPYINPPKEIGL
jgi:hypothetical protein